MKANIQFEKIGVKRNLNSKKTTAIFCSLLFLSALIAATFYSVYAYFTASATKNGSTQFGTIDVSLLNGSTAFTAATFKTKYLTNIYPGSTIKITDATIKNNGDFDEYVLLNLDISIPSSTGVSQHYNIWYNTYGEEVNVANMQVNATKATLVQAKGSTRTNIQWKVPGEVINNHYKNQTATVKLTAYATQTILPNEHVYRNKALYASYFICSQASNIAQSFGLTYNGIQINGEPLRCFVGKNKLKVEDVFADNGFYQIEDENLIVKSKDSRAWASLPKIKLKGNTSYTISSTNATNMDIRIPDGTSIVNKTASSISFTTPSHGFIAIKLGVYDTAYPHTVGKIQIEEGSTATAYEIYGPTQDVLDMANQTVTRNIGTLTLTGDETWEEGLSFDYEYSLSKANFPNINNTYGLQNMASSHFALGENANNADKPLTFRAGTSYLNFNYDDGASGLDGFKAWLKEQYENGTPVTIWYERTTPTTEKVFTSKNLFDGYQNLHFESGSSNNNISEAGTLYITSGALANPTGLYPELGGEVFNHLFDKPFTISFKLKIHEDDNRTNPRVTISLRDSIDNEVNAYQAYYKNMPNDGLWHTYSISTDAPADISASKITKIVVWMCDYSQFAHAHIEIKDVQIEIGEGATDFESYDPTVYQRVNGYALRQVEDVKDTYNPSTKTITRNVVKKVFDGTESWNLASKYNDGTVRIYLGQAQTGMANGVENKAYCKDFKLGLWGNRGSVGAEYLNHFFIGQADTSNSNVGLQIRVADTYTAASWKNYLLEKYNSQDPLVIYYAVSVPSTETIS